VALFALKAGLLPVPKKIRHGWNPEKAFKWAILIAGGMTLVGFFGAFLFFAMTTFSWFPDVERAYAATYGIPGCTYPDMIGPHGPDRCLFGSAWNVIKFDALPFFIATFISLYRRTSAAHARRFSKSVWPFIMPALVGAGVFFISIYFWEWLEIAPHGIQVLIERITSAAIHEITAPIEFIKAVLSNDANIAVANWFRDELVRINGSFYKMASLYPKVVIVLLVGGLAHYAFRMSIPAPE
jgi:hypothetical protein